MLSSISAEAHAAESESPEATDPPLLERVRSGISWNASSILLVQAVAFVRSIIIARVLFPEDFGLFGMALTVIAALNAFTTIGLDYSIIAGKFKTTELRTHLDTVWSAELLRSGILTLLIAASAYPMARFYGQPKLYLLIPLLSLTTLIQGFRNIGLVLLRKEISFAKIFWCEQASNLAATAFAIALVLVVRNVWALVLSQVASAALSVFFSYVFHPYRPRFAFHKDAYQSALNFGKFALVIAVTSYVTTMADNVMVGRLLGITALGYYAIAYNLSSLPVVLLVHTFDRVMFPAYSELASRNPKRLPEALTSVFSLILLLLLMLTVPMCLLAKEIVELLYGMKWSPASSALQVLALIAPLRGGMLIISTLFFGLNRPKLVASGKTLEAILFLLILFPLTKAFGLTGAAWAGVIVYAVALVNRLVALESAIPGASARLIRVCLSSALAGGLGLLVGSVSLTFSDSRLPRILLAGSASTIAVVLVSVLLNGELRKVISSLVPGGKRRESAT